MQGYQVPTKQQPWSYLWLAVLTLCLLWIDRKYFFEELELHIFWNSYIVSNYFLSAKHSILSYHRLCTSTYHKFPVCSIINRNHPSLLSQQIDLWIIEVTKNNSKWLISYQIKDFIEIKKFSVIERKSKR